MSLHNDLARFDGKSIAVLEEIKAREVPSPELLDTLITIAGREDQHMQTGATWLIRAFIEDGATLPGEQVGRLASILPGLHDGFGRLHLCQAMRRLEIPREDAPAFADFFRSCDGTSNTFLRAWAPYGLFRLALQHEEYLTEAVARVERALSDPAASVRARARKTLEEA